MTNSRIPNSNPSSLKGNIAKTSHVVSFGTQAKVRSNFTDMLFPAGLSDAQ